MRRERSIKVKSCYGERVFLLLLLLLLLCFSLAARYGG
jgi:hypothetical protein